LGDSKKSDLASTVESRLAGLFGGDDDSVPSGNPPDSQAYEFTAETDVGPVEETDGPEPAGSPVRKLKEIVLSIEWEITDEILDRLLGEVNELRTVFEADRSLCLSLQLLGSVGKYLQKDKSNAHPESVKLLHDIFNSIEWLSVDDTVSEEDKKQRVQENIAEFKALKEKIASRKRAAGAAAAPRSVKADPEETAAAEPTAPAGSPDTESIEKILELMRQMKPQEAFAYMLVEIRKVIRQELSGMK
jgi:hypothetical protein